MIKKPYFIINLSIFISAFIPGYFLRGLYADGSLFLFDIINKESFRLYDTGRRFAHILQECCLVLFIKIGIVDVDVLAKTYSLSVNLIPVFFLIITYFIIPNDKKHFFIFPISFYLVGVEASSFASVGGGPIAGSYFWLIIFYIIFSSRSVINDIVILILSVVTIEIHESFSVLAIILIMAILYRIKSSRHANIFIGLFPIISFCMSSYCGWFYFIHPHLVENKTSFIQQTMELRFIYSHGCMNLPLLLGLFFSGAVLSMFIRKNASAEKRKMMMIFTLIAVGNAVAPLLTGRNFLPSQHFYARYYCVLLIPIISAIFWFAMGSEAFQQYIKSRFVTYMIFLLCIGQCGWHLSSTVLWNRYIGWFRNTLETNSGIVPYERALEGSEPGNRNLINKMTWKWTNPVMSILLSKEGKIRTIVANPIYNKWDPFNINDLNNILNKKYFELLL
jgi:hypothetical protein